MTPQRSIEVLADVLRRQVLSVAEATACEDALTQLSEVVQKSAQPPSSDAKSTPAPSGS